MASDTTISNMALDRLSANKVLDDYTDTTDTSQEAVLCRRHLPQAREALLRMFDWPFAKTRLLLKEHDDSPAFEWNNQFLLPDDYLRLTQNYDEQPGDEKDRRWEIEGRRLLTDYSTVRLSYIRKVTDPTEFDPLFIETLILATAHKLVYPLTGGGKAAVELAKDIKKELGQVYRRARIACKGESARKGRSNWNLARYSSPRVRTSEGVVYG